MVSVRSSESAGRQIIYDDNLTETQLRPFHAMLSRRVASRHVTSRHVASRRVASTRVNDTLAPLFVSFLQHPSSSVPRRRRKARTRTQALLEALSATQTLIVELSFHEFFSFVREFFVVTFEHKPHTTLKSLVNHKNHAPTFRFLYFLLQRLCTLHAHPFVEKTKNISTRIGIP